MKQTNNAIKFLMAQYRAIFKNAYFKGITTAVALTAALSATAAQAATYTTIDSINQADKDPLVVNTANDLQVVVSGNGSINKNITISSTGNTITSDASGSDLVVSANSKTLQITQKGALTVGSLDTSSERRLEVQFGKIDIDTGAKLDIYANKGKSSILAGDQVNISGEVNIHTNSGTGSAFLQGAEINLLAGSKVVLDSSTKFEGTSPKIVSATLGGFTYESKNITGSKINVSEADLILKSNTSTNANTLVSAEFDASKRASAEIRGSSLTLDKSRLISEGTGDNTTINGTAAILSHQVNIKDSLVYVKNASNLHFNPQKHNDAKSKYSNMNGTININGGTVALGGGLVLNRGGVLDISKDTNLFAASPDANKGSGTSPYTTAKGALVIGVTNNVVKSNKEEFVNTTNPTLKIDSKTLTDFFTADSSNTVKTKDTNGSTDITLVDHAGALVLTDGARVEFKDTENVDVSKFTYGLVTKDEGQPVENNVANIFAHQKNSTTNLVGPTTGENLSAKQIDGTIQMIANNMTISKSLLPATVATEGQVNSSENIIFVAKDMMTLGGNADHDNSKGLGVKGIIAKNITFVGKDKAAFNLQDNVTLRSVRDATIDGKDLVVGEKGNIIGDVVVSGGKTLAIDGGHYTDAYDITLDSGNLVVGKPAVVLGKKDASADSSLTLTGNFILNSGKNNTVTIESHGKNASAFLDLTGAESVAFDKTPAEAGLTTFKITGDYAKLKINGDDLTTLLHAGSETSGAAFVLSGGSTLQVDGSLGDTEHFISVANLNTDGTQVSGGEIIFSGGANNIVNTLSTENLYLKDNSSGAADILNIGSGKIETGNLYLSGAEGNKVFDFDGGTLTVLNGISNANNSLETLDINGGILNLGKLNSDTDATAAIGGGSVGVKNLKITSGGVTFQGVWSADNVETAASGVSIGQFGKVTFNSLKATAAKSVDIANGGSLMVNGLSGDKNGLSLATGSIGLSGYLTLGKDIADDITVSGDKVTASGGISSKAINISGGTLQINFGSDRSFSSQELGALKNHLFGKTGTVDGTLHIGDGKIGELDLGEKDNNGRYDFSNVANVADVTGNGITSNDLTNNAFTTTNGQNVGGTVGAIHVTNGSSANISNSAGFVNSSTNKGFFVSTNQNGQDVAADINFSGTKLSLKNGGAAGEISLDSSKSSLSISATDDKQITNLKSISGGKKLEIAGNTVVEGNVSTNEAVIDKSLKAQNATFASLSSTKAETAGSLDIAKDLTVSSATEFTGDIKVAGKATFGAAEQSTYLAGNNTFNDLEFKGNAQLDKGTTSAQNLKVTNNNLEINGGANVKVSGVLETNGNIIVGEDQGKNETESWESSAGYLTAKRVDLDTNSILIADPDFGKAASIVAIEKLGKETEDFKSVAGVLRGQAVAARNSIIALGVAESEEAAAIKSVQSTFGQYFDENGSLKSDEVGAIAFVAKSLTLDSGAKLVVDSTMTNDKYLSRTTNEPSTGYNAKISDSSIYIGQNSVLGVDEKALTKERAAIHINEDKASVYGEQGAKIVLTGQSIGTTGAVHLFSDKGEGAESGVEIKGNDILVESINGVLKYTLTKDSTVSDIQLEVDRNAAKHKFANNTSDSTYYTLMAYNTGDLNWEDANSQNHTIDLVHNGEATDVVYDAATNQYKSGNKVLDNKLYTHKVVTNEKGEVVKYIVYNVRTSDFLKDDFANSNGSSTETVSRLGMYGGAAQAAIQASASTYNSISGHLGIGSSQFSISSAANGQGGAVWVSPIYNSLDSDGLSTGGLKYGADVDLYGLALGGDFSLTNGFKVGAMFNVGSGDADGNGAGSGVKNDFNYYGLGVYGTYSINNFSVLGDLTYTVVDNDVDAQTALDKVSTSFDTKTLSLGLTAQYDIELANSLKITPHAGIRFTNVDIENYTVKGEKYGEFAYYDADNLNIFSIPVGVTFAKEFVGEAWTVKPSFDLTLTGNFGDDETKARTYWEGVENLSTEAYNEVLDNFTYGAALGVSATNGNFSFGAGLNYTGSSNTDSFGVKATVRYAF